MGRHEMLLELEKRFWNADEDFYRNYLAEGAVMVFPEPAGVLERSEILDSLGGGIRWQHIEVSNDRFIEIRDDVVQLIYEAVAVRTEDGSEYSALITSTYVGSDGSWQLFTHQQTPIPDER